MKTSFVRVFTFCMISLSLLAACKKEKIEEQAQIKVDFQQLARAREVNSEIAGEIARAATSPKGQPSKANQSHTSSNNILSIISAD
jgi:NTP pyrophosphatase (non-canonical NTP hydrolase)